METKIKNIKNRDEIRDTARQKSNANLKPYKKGESGNPKGRPKGLLDFNTRVNIAIDRLANEFVKQHNNKHKDKITLDDVDIMGDVFAQLVNKARSGDLKAVDSLLDRAYGKATQPVEVGGIKDNPLAEAQRKAAMAEADAWQAQWLSVTEEKDANKKTTRKTKKKSNK